MPAHNALEGSDHLSPHVQGIHTQVRHSPMALAADDLDIKTVHSGHDGTGLHPQHSLGNAGPEMAAEGIVHLGVVHYPLFDHGLCTAGPFLCRLEDELDIPRELIFDGVQNSCCTDHHGHVSVMAAGMHGPFMG